MCLTRQLSSRSRWRPGVKVKMWGIGAQLDASESSCTTDLVLSSSLTVQSTFCLATSLNPLLLRGQTPRHDASPPV